MKAMSELYPSKLENKLEESGIERLLTDVLQWVLQWKRMKVTSLESSAWDGCVMPSGRLHSGDNVTYAAVDDCVRVLDFRQTLNEREGMNGRRCEVLLDTDM